jgi:general secretion pathway protein F/MSHA biogenesis protein MshG
MKYFEVTYIFKGKKAKKVIKATSREDAVSISKTKTPGVVIKVNEIEAPLEDKMKEFFEQVSSMLFKKSIKLDNLITSFRQLAVMVNAGISIHDSIREVKNATVDKRLQEIFTKIDDDLNSGLSLTVSVNNFKNELGEVTVAMIELGETTGNMAESLTKLSDILEEVRDNRAKFKKAMRYPTTVIVAIFVAFSIIMIYVVPQFKTTFEDLGAELPLPTQILMTLEKMFNEYGSYSFAALMILVFIYKYYKRTSKEFNDFLDKHLLKVYLIGKVIFFSTMSRFFLVLTELIRAGLPVAEALDTAVLTVDNSEIKKKLAAIRISVERGVSLTDAFRETDLMQGMLVQMISAGEQSGMLDTMLDKVTEYYKSRFQEIIDNLTAYIEPILLAFIAGMALLLALGIFLPMWDLAGAVKN